MGTIVGIYEFNFEVLFDEAFIGGTTLGGRCSIARGAMIEFTDVFNVDPSAKWANKLERRD